jgi:L-seryl-tRNA(Ser) seleniumtransferase
MLFIQFINATGIILHTNLGRAPLKREWLIQLADLLSGYCNLEYDLSREERGERTLDLEAKLQAFFGVEAAVIVNNAAAALFLTLNTFSVNREVIVSRGELVQIGGGFRLPDIIESSHAKLKEVGTTNITRIQDYEKAVGVNTSCILKVHPSCYQITGHSHQPSYPELSALAAKRKLGFFVDLGSGIVSNKNNPDWLTVQNVLRAGPDAVLFSGDKMFGGPQAGIIVGRKKYLNAMKQSPLYRALRLGKTEIFLLEQAVTSHLKGKGTAVDELIGLTSENIRERTESLRERLTHLKVPCRVFSSSGAIGGGSLPGEELPSWAVEVSFKEKSKLASKKLSEQSLPIIFRKRRDSFLFDLRTVFANEEDSLCKSIEETWSCLF